MRTLCCYLALFLCLTSSALAARVLTPATVPDPLKPWTDWVLSDQDDYGCAFMYNQFEQKYCYWPSQLQLQLSSKQGQFSGRWHVQRESWVELPGGENYWPQQVLVNHQPAAVVARDGRPALKLPAGDYAITGHFAWDYIPEQLQIPEDTGLIALSINQVAMPAPTIKEGLLWLKDSERGANQGSAMQDSLELQVYRQIIDEVPLQVKTRLELDVAGSVREIKLPQALLAHFIPMQLDSALPARLEADGQLLVQLRPGHWQIDLWARATEPLESLGLTQQPEWPESEIWVFAAQPDLRVVEIKGVDAIDASQTTLPAEWANLPAYRVNAGQALAFTVLRRGNPEAEPNQLQLNKQLWLDFDGQGYSVSDQITGQMTQGWRLEALPTTQLGKVSLDGNNQLITRISPEQAGVEVRQGQLNVQADSRYSGDIRQLSATGWQQAFQQVRAEINLPPGWQLVAASGVDNVPESWVARWTLLDLFMVLIAALAVAKLWDRPLGVITLITLALIWHEAEAPHWIWLHILAATALLRALPVGKLQSLINSYRKACGVVLLLSIIPFMLLQVRLGLYPQLEQPWQEMAAQPRYSAALAPASPEQLATEAEGPAPAQANISSLPKSRALPSYYSADAAKKISRQDSDANVQTGPGLPQWQWHKIHLSWNGVVDSQQQLTLWYASPKVSMLLNFMRIILLSFLTLTVFGQWRLVRRLLFTRAELLPLCLFALLLTPAPHAKADFPAQPVLDELKTRLLVAPECLPACADISHLNIAINAQQLALTLSIAAQDTVTLPLPAQQSQWLPQSVRVNGRDNAALQRDTTGQLWLKITPGAHQVILQGPAPVQEKFTLSLPLQPHHVSYTQTGWAISGVHEHGNAEQQLQFSRINPSADLNKAKFSAETAPPLFRIERTLHLGLDWRVENRVLRLTPADTAAVLAVPLLPGEAVLTAGLRTEQHQVLLNIDAQQSESSWESVLSKTAQLELLAADTSQWVEVWRVDVSPVWHMQTEGLAPVHPTQNNAWIPEWRPWPKEKLLLQLTRPEAVAGQTLTLQRSELTVTPGQRLTEATLNLQVESSRGGQHTLLLPADIELQSVHIDNQQQPLRLQENKLTLPLKPGSQTWQIVWRQTQALTSTFHTPAVNVGLAHVNAHINVHVAQDRWILFTLGPDMGPAVLFWGLLLVMALLSWVLAQTHLTPLNARQWFLLWVGLSQIPLPAALMVPAWFILLGARDNYSPVDTDTQNAVYTYNATQILIVLLGIAAAGSLFFAVEEGLLGTPEMQIMGNLSTAYQLHWYQDRSAAELPTAGIISVPLWVYRGLMLAWSLWLAQALLRWLQWGWRRFAQQGLWHKLATPPNS